MPWKANVPTAFKRLFSRLKITSSGEAVPLLSEVIVPVTDMDDLMRRPKIVSASVTTGGSGLATGPTVTTGKRWLLRALWVTRTGGTANIDAWGIYNVATTRIDCQQFTAAANYAVVLPQPLTLDSGWAIYGSFSGAAAHDIIALVDEEDTD